MTRALALALALLALATACQKRRREPARDDGLLVAAPVAPDVAWNRCRAALHMPLSDVTRWSFRDACADAFRQPDCRDALRSLHARSTFDDGIAVVERCARAYCPLEGQPLCTTRSVTLREPAIDDLLRAALVRDHAATDDEQLVAQGIVGALAPLAALELRFSAQRAELLRDSKPVGTVETDAWDEPSLARVSVAVKAAVPERAIIQLVLRGGSHLGDQRGPFMRALSEAGVTEMVTCNDDNSNCPR